MRQLRLVVLLLFSLVVLTLFSRGLLHSSMFFAHDFTHVGRISEMRRALEGGQFPVTWTQNFGFGYGMPLFLFYGPLPFYLGVGLTWLGLSDIAAMKMLFGLSGVLAFSGILAWFRSRGMSVALAAATVLLAFPYRAVDIYVRGALNEVLALGMLPWVLVAARLTTRSPKKGILLTSISVAALLLTHNLTALMGIPIMAGLGLVWILLFDTDRRRSILSYAAGGFLGVGLALFYVLPSLVESRFTAIDAILGGYFDYRLHFLYIRQFFRVRWEYGGSVFGPDDGMSFHLGLPVLIAVVGSVLAVGWHKWKIWQKNSHKHFWQRTQQFFTAKLIWTGFLLFSLALTLFLTLGHSQPIWQVVPFFMMFQFPWRWLTVVGVLSALLVGDFLTLIPKREYRWGATLVILVIALTQARFHQPASYMDRPESLYSSDPARIRKSLSSILPDYIPRDFDQSLPPVDTANRVLLNEQTLREDFSTPHRFRFFVDDRQPGTVLWNVADFPGWQYVVNDQIVNADLRSDGRREFISSEPVESVGAVFTPTPIRSWTLAVSGLAALTWIVLALPMPVGSQQKNKETHVTRL